ncbi:HNH endonuclease [Paenibacillus sp. FSL W8-1287]|uniref:HNH endonuclease n=1 Tax=Paenibacillus sp. FSL W8-1287 TaxID=2954653 RepID=UPI0030CD1334
MPLFTKELLKSFRGTIGAYSQVTNREATGDKSVTVDTHEKSVLHAVYRPTTFARRGGAIRNVPNPYKEFIVHDDRGNTYKAELSIVYPKAEGNELRLYFRSGVFDPSDGDYWFIFTRDGEDIPHIGWMSPRSWSDLDSYLNQAPKDSDLGIKLKSQENIDDEDAEYQRQIGAATVKLPTSSSVMKYPRNPNVALNALKAANYTCEANPEHTTFLSVTGKPFAECHHLIPVSLQSKFPEASLDVEENVVVLCPNCHRHVHYGVGQEKRELLDKLWDARNKDLARREIRLSYDEFLSIYLQ